MNYIVELGDMYIEAENEASAMAKTWDLIKRTEGACVSVVNAFEEQGEIHRDQSSEFLDSIWMESVATGDVRDAVAEFQQEVAKECDRLCEENYWVKLHANERSRR